HALAVAALQVGVQFLRLQVNLAQERPRLKNRLPLLPQHQAALAVGDLAEGALVLEQQQIPAHAPQQLPAAAAAGDQRLDVGQLLEQVEQRHPLQGRQQEDVEVVGAMVGAQELPVETVGVEHHQQAAVLRERLP